MNKPISMIMEESKQQIIEAINNTKLDAYFLEIILRDIYAEVQQIASKQYISEKMEYEKYLQEQNKRQDTELIAEA